MPGGTSECTHFFPFWGGILHAWVGGRAEGGGLKKWREVGLRIYPNSRGKKGVRGVA